MAKLAVAIAKLYTSKAELLEDLIQEANMVGTACGMYLMRLTNNEGTRVQKVIIDKK